MPFANILGVYLGAFGGICGRDFFSAVRRFFYFSPFSKLFASFLS
jgi:hypothetical protein